jgi:hypothetical protein
MDFFRVNDCLLVFRIAVLWLCSLTIASTKCTRAFAQGVRTDLLLPDTPDYASLSENGKHLFDGLTNNGQYHDEAIIVRMRPIAEVLSNNRLQITIPGRAEEYDVHIKTIEYSDDRNYKIYGTVGESLLSVLLTSRNGMKGGMMQGPSDPTKSATWVTTASFCWGMKTMRESSTFAPPALARPYKSNRSTSLTKREESRATMRRSSLV